MKKTFNILAKTVSLLNLIVAVCRGEGVDSAVVSFNNCWN